MVLVGNRDSYMLPDRVEGKRRMLPDRVQVEGKRRMDVRVPNVPPPVCMCGSPQCAHLHTDVGAEPGRDWATQHTKHYSWPQDNNRCPTKMGVVDKSSSCQVVKTVSQTQAFGVVKTERPVPGLNNASLSVWKPLNQLGQLTSSLQQQIHVLC